MLESLYAELESKLKEATKLAEDYKVRLARDELGEAEEIRKRIESELGGRFSELGINEQLEIIERKVDLERRFAEVHKLIKNKIEEIIRMVEEASIE